MVHHDDLFHIFYRAQGVDYVSRIGYTVSADGVHFNRLTEPILEPREIWEFKGDVPNTIFSAVDPVVDGMVYVYYGGADRVIGLATCALDECWTCRFQ